MSESTNTTNIQPSNTTQRNNPYVGPRTFQFEQADRFFGREREARELLAIVSTERLTLFYAQSGAGKSSLLNTRLIPGLQNKGFEVLPVGRVGSTGIVSAASNPFVINLVHSLLSASVDLAQLAELSLTDFLTCLVYGERGYALLESPPPTLSQGGGAPIPRVLIIDQFEEILTTQITAWAQRGAFFAQLAAAMQADPYLWVILTLREDYVAGLDPYAHYFPGGFRSRYYMQRMGRGAALEAVQRPAAGIGQRPFAPGVAEQLVDNLRLVQNSWSNEPATKLIQGEFVEPVQLQVVCYQLWERLQEEQKSGQEEAAEPRGSGQPVEKKASNAPITPRYITESDLKRLAGQRELVAFVNQALADYYEQGIAKVSQLPAITLNERAVRDWFSTKLITPEETRGLVNQGEEESGGLPNAVVNLLADLFLIRAENRAGGVWYELVHDRFIQPILEANRSWLLAQSNPLTAVTRIWVTSDRDPERLLRGTQLADAQEYARTHPNWVGQDEKEFLAASIRRESEAKARQQRALIITTLIVTLLAGLVYWGWRGAVEAIRQRSSALAAQNYAETQLMRARAGELAAQSQNALASFPQRSLLLAIEAVSATQAITVRVPAAEEALRQALAVVDTPPLGNHRARISAMTTSSDNHWLVTVSDDGNALLWNLQAADPAANPIVLRGDERGISAVAISPDSHWLVTADYNGTARLWDLQAADPAASPIVLRGHESGISAVAISPDNHWLVTASYDSTARLWDLQAADPAATPIVLRGHEYGISAVAISPDNHWLVTAGGYGSGPDQVDTTARLWDLQSADPAATPIVLRGHEYGIRSLAISSDNHWLVAASGDSTARLWDLQAADPAATPIVLSGDERGISAVALSSDSHWLVTADYNGTARLWDLQATDPAATPIVLRGHSPPLTAVAISPDNHWLVTASYDSTARLWDLHAADPAATPIVLRGHESGISAVAISPDNHWLVTASYDSTARLWDLHAADPAANPIVLRGHDGGIAVAQFTPNNRWLVTAGGVTALGADASVRLWDLSNAHLILSTAILRGHESGIQSLAISSDSHWLVTVGGYGAVPEQVDTMARLWDLQSADPAATPIVLRGHESGISAVAISPDNHWLVTASDDSTARLWDLQAADPAATPIILRGHAYGISAVAISSDNHWLVTASGDSTARLWDLQSADPAAIPIVLHLHEGGITAIAISPDNHWLVTAGGYGSGPDQVDTTARLWDLHAADPAATPIVLRSHKYGIRSLAISPDNHWLVTAGGYGSGPDQVDTTARLWDLQSADPAATPIVLRGHKYGIRSLALSSDSHWLVTADYNGTARLWDLQAADPAATPIVLSGDERGISAVALSSDSHWLVTASDDSTARLWDLQATDPAATPIVLRGHESGISTVAISPDNHWLVTASDDSTARLWDLQAADPAANPIVLRGHESGISAVAISPDNHWLVTASTDKSARLWDLHIDELLNKACQTAARNLSYAEWTQYFPSEPYRKTCLSFPIHFSIIADQITRGDDLAGSGNITDALALYQGALAMEPTLNFTPTAKAAAALLPYAAELARSGEITVAIATYQQALILDPTLPITPEVTAKQQYASIVVDRATELAQRGEITAATTAYQQAVTLDSTLLITPEVAAKQEYASIVVDQATELAQRGEITAATAAYQQAVTLDSTLSITPEVEAKQRYASIVVDRATELAQRGEITAAIAAYQQAVTLDSTLSITPEVEAKQQYAAVVVEQAAELATRNEITAAIEAYQQALDLDPSLEIEPTQAAKRIATLGLIEQAKQLAQDGKTAVAITKLKEAQTIANALNSPILHLNICRMQTIETLAEVSTFSCQAVFTQTPVVSASKSVTGTVLSAIGDLWKLEILSNSRITITLSTSVDSALDPYLTLYDTNFKVLKEHDDIVLGEILDSAINNQVLMKPGDYFIQASRCCPNDDHSSQGAYILEVIVKPDE